MTTYTFTLGGTSLPLPDANETLGMDYFAMATSRRMANGALRQQVTASRWRVPLKFVGLTAAEYTTVFNAYSARILSSASAVFPDGKTKTVMAIAGSWQERQYFNEWYAETRYDVNFTVEEV